MSAVGRITGPLLKADLLRNEVDLAFETDLLYLDVNTHADGAGNTDGSGLVGIKTNSPTHDLTVNGTTRTVNLITDIQADIADITILGNDISTTESILSLTPSGVSPVVYQARLRVDDIDITNNVISTNSTNTNLEIRPDGTGEVHVFANMNVDGDIHATGDIQIDGTSITFGDADTDSIDFNADVASDIIPDTDNTWTLGTGGTQYDSANDFALGDATLVVSAGVGTLSIPAAGTTWVDALTAYTIPTVFLVVLEEIQGSSFNITTSGVWSGTNPQTITVSASTIADGSYNITRFNIGAKRWADVWTNALYADTIDTGDLVVDNINLNLRQENILYVAKGGSDSYSGTHQNDPYLTVEYALSQATAGTTILIYPGEYEEVFPLTVPVGVTVKGTGIRSVKIVPTVATNTNDAFLLNGETTVEDLTIADFYSPGYAFKFATGFTVTSRSPYIRNITVLTKGSVTDPVTDPLGFDEGDAGKGAYIDGAVATASSKEASMLFHSVTFITPGVDCISATNGARIEWLNSFTYYADKAFYAFNSNDGLALDGKTRLRINNTTGVWNVGNTLTYYDTDGTTVLATGTIESIDGDFYVIDGNSAGFETVTDRTGKLAYVNGDAQLSSTQVKFGTTSLALDGTGDYVRYDIQPDFGFGTGNFTLETWVYKSADTGQETLLDFRTAASDNAVALGIRNANKPYVYVNGTYQIDSATALNLNAWNHVAYVREGTTGTLYLNGVSVGTWSDNTDYGTTKPLTIGAGYTGTFTFLTGYLDDIRIVKGVAKYTAGFTPPVNPLTGDINTVLLLHFNGTDGGTTIDDDGVTYQDLRTSAGGTANLINFADYSDFGAEVRAIASAAVYGNYGFYGDGSGVIAYLISQNFAYVGAGKDDSNDPTTRIDAQEVEELNDAHVYYTSVDNEGNFKVGDYFHVNQKTGDVTFNGEAFAITALAGITFTDGTDTTIINPGEVTVNNIKIYDNNIDSITGDINVTSSNGEINLQNDTYITGNLDVTGDITIGGNIQIGDEATDTVSFVAGITSDLIPSTTATYDLGTDSLRWNTVYVSRVEIDDLIIDSNTIATTSNNDDLTLTANGTGRIYIPSNDVEIDQNLTVTTDLTVTTGLTTLQDVGITGNITQTGNIDLTGDYTVSGTADISNNVTVNGNLYLDQISISTNIIATTPTDTDLELQANGAGAVVFESLRVQDNDIQSTVTNSGITLTPQGTGNVIIDSNQSLIIPVGTTLERPAVPENGMIRYNTTIGRYEGYSDGEWIALAGVESVDGLTRILPEATPGAGDNILYFYANNNLTATIDEDKLYTVNLQTDDLEITGNTISALAPDTDINFVTSGTGGVVLEGLKFDAGTITNTVADAVTEIAQQGTGYVKVAGTFGLVVPSGGNADRPAPQYSETGMIRFNTDNQFMEVYNGVAWTSVAGTSSGVTFNDATEIGIAMALTVG